MCVDDQQWHRPGDGLHSLDPIHVQGVPGSVDVVVSTIDPTDMHSGEVAFMLSCCHWVGTDCL